MPLCRSSSGWVPAALSDTGEDEPTTRYLWGEEGESMKKLIKIVFVVAIAGIVAAVVASAVSKKKLSSMSDDEIRAFLDSKLSGKVGEDQLGSIQTAVIAGVRRGGSTVEGVEDLAGEVEAAVTEVEEEVKQDVEDLGEEIAEISEDAEAAVEDATT